ncbi:unnamed protein product [Ceratitis capitata]|uniref:(Mediterranean fruit fly) hypothetical protein n=1 Tax=Ceratitis capitata TaxID=7213 RepID=A0A811VBD5_CERCA|nr:unnamed protein product [Ceratitis capitata]
MFTDEQRAKNEVSFRQSPKRKSAIALNHQTRKQTHKTFPIAKTSPTPSSATPASASASSATRPKLQQ